MKVVIVGGVAGGATCAARLRRLDEHAKIIMVERTGYVSYANCGLPYYVGGVIQDKSKLTLQTPESFRRRFNVDVRVRQEATMIDLAKKSVHIRNLDDGSSYDESFDELVLSPGAQPMRPPIAGANDPRIQTLRTVEDSMRIKELIGAKKPKRAVVVGGGFIGLEVAENLLSAGVRTTLLEFADHVMPPLDADMAALVHNVLRAHGLDLRLGTAASGFEPLSEDARSGMHVSTSDGSSIDADIVVMGVGVTPDTQLAKDAGLKLGLRGSIVVDRHLRTSAPHVWAIGDAIQLTNAVTGLPALVALAGPANKQGRIAADNICGLNETYEGALGSSILKLFDTTVATTGLSEKAATQAGISHDSVVLHPASHAGYYPGAAPMDMKVVFSPEDGRILGAQIVGKEGVDKRIDVLATAISAHMTADDLAQLDLAYAPPYSSAKDPVNMAGYVIGNVLAGREKIFHTADVDKLPRDGSVFLLDCRTSAEYARGHMEGFVNIAVDDLREHLGEIPRDRPVYVTCQVGLRGYIACRILSGNDIDCYNLTGGYGFWHAVQQGGVLRA
jgi:NADPH-dependent 2,4-dienoyl-CoA reductase/sulfur reductase-like enzyme/rhodanese-related sulfurtransferase